MKMSCNCKKKFVLLRELWENREDAGKVYDSEKSLYPIKVSIVSHNL